MYFSVLDRYRPLFPARSRPGFRCVLAGLCALFLVAGCARLQPNEGPVVVSLVLEAPLEIPPHRAHAKFQGGRQVQGVNRYEPWCKLETNEVSERPRRIAPGRFPVRRIGQAFIADYHTRMPVAMVGLGCNDLLFQETTLRVDRRISPRIRYLRCFAPYANCNFGPPLSPGRIQEVLGSRLRLAPERGSG